jgi:hypothetical protein
MTDQFKKTVVTTSVDLPTGLRVELDEVRIARARRTGGVCPPLRVVVIEALEDLVRRELHP